MQLLPNSCRLTKYLLLFSIISYSITPRNSLSTHNMKLSTIVFEAFVATSLISSTVAAGGNKQLLRGRHRQLENPLQEQIDSSEEGDDYYVADPFATSEQRTVDASDTNGEESDSSSSSSSSSSASGSSSSSSSSEEGIFASGSTSSSSGSSD